MVINFTNLGFTVKDDFITMGGVPFIEIGVAGRNKLSRLGSKLVKSSETPTLKYVTHKIVNGSLYITQRNDIIEVITEFKNYGSDSVVSMNISVKNISEKPITIVNASFVYPLGVTFERCNQVEFTRFVQGHHSECQPRTDTLENLGLNRYKGEMQCRVAQANIGSWSTKEALPQGLLKLPDDKFVFFQIESHDSWYYEISDRLGELYVCLDGGNEAFGGWYKTLKCGDSLKTVNFALAFGNTASGAIEEITSYRSVIAGKCTPDENLPVIFNEYMWLSWDSPCEENTKKYAQFAAKAGAEYYVIDCGWHDEVDGSIIYPFVGEWKESKVRFPHGVKYTTDYIRSLGLKSGLWIEPEIVGIKCEKMLNYYDDDCFITRYKERVEVGDRLFLDFRAKKVREYLTKTIERMIEEYGADYIKLDYNQDVGIGAERDADGYGDGLKKCSAAYFEWIDDIRHLYPNTIFETCSSGGMRMDYETLRHFSIVSTSDQTDYLKYPYIAGNILAAVIPEQAAVWSYPAVGDHIGKEQVIMNMINSFIGRMHLASDLSKLNSENFALVKEGVEYSKRIKRAKKTALPVFPFGFTKFGEKHLAFGFKTKERIYLAVYNLGGENVIKIPVCGGKKVIMSYPQKQGVFFNYENEVLIVNFTELNQARFFEITIS